MEEPILDEPTGDGEPTKLPEQKVSPAIIECARKELNEAVNGQAYYGLFAVALHLTGNPADANDLTHDTLERAYRFIDHYTPGSNLFAWLNLIMKNLFINKYRRKKRFDEACETEIDSGVLRWVDDRERMHVRRPDDDRSVGNIRDAFSDEVVTVLDGLPLRWAVMVLLVDHNGFAYKEVAEALDIPIGTVMSSLHRARKLFRNALCEYAIETNDAKTGKAA